MAQNGFGCRTTISSFEWAIACAHTIMRHCMRNNTFCCHYFEIALRKCVALKIWPFILSHSMYSMECLWFSVYYLIKTTKLLRHLRRCRYTHRYCRQKLCLQWQTNTSERRVTSLSVASMGFVLVSIWIYPQRYNNGLSYTHGNIL